MNDFDDIPNPTPGQAAASQNPVALPDNDGITPRERDRVQTLTAKKTATSYRLRPARCQKTGKEFRIYEIQFRYELPDNSFTAWEQIATFEASRQLTLLGVRPGRQASEVLAEVKHMFPVSSLDIRPLREDAEGDLPITAR